MPDVEGTCEYVLKPDDPETRGGEEGDECYVDEQLLNENGVWTCPHDPEDGEELCIFHTPTGEKDVQSVVYAFEKRLEDSKKADENGVKTRIQQFIGAKFGDFIYSGEICGSKGIRINLKHSQFIDKLDLSNTKIKNNIYFTGSHFHSTSVS